MRSRCTAAALVFAVGTIIVAPVAGLGATEAGGFPIRLPGTNTSTGLLVADLDGDGRPEVAAVVGEGFAIVRGDGSVREGFPVAFSDPAGKTKVVVDSAPVACDVDGNGTPEVVIASSNRRLWAVRADATVPEGFPLLLDDNPSGELSCVEGRDLVLVTSAGTLVRVSGGKVSKLGNVGKGAESGIGVADLDGDGVLDFAVGGGDAKLHVIDASGKRKQGFPYGMQYKISGIPAIGDVDDDGRADLVFGSMDFKIHAVGADGKALPGFPVGTGYRLYGGVALVDLNGDYVLDVVAGSGDGKVYALSGSGGALPGFPVEVDERVIASVVAGDLDKDGRPEIAAVTQGGSLYVFDARGKRVLQERLGGKVEIAPALADLDGDGLPEIVASAPNGTVHAYSLGAGAAGKAEAALVAWGQIGHDAAHGGRFAPNPARFKDLGFKTAEHFTTDPVEVRYTFFDLDNEPERDTKIRWYADGAVQSDLDDARVVPPERTTKHQKWRYTVQGGENFATYGAGASLSRIASSREIEVLNTTPAAPQIDLSPKEAFTDSTLKVSVTQPSVDPDGDSIEYRHVWITDDKVQKRLPPDTTSVAPQLTRKHETWKVVVVPFDGEAEGATTSASVTLRNTPPGPPEVALAPSAVRIEDRLQVQITKPAVDIDGDPVTYRYDYIVNDRLLGVPRERGSIAPGVLRKHQAISVTVTAVDDDEPGASVGLATKVINTPPAAPVVAVWPEVPRTLDPLVIAITTQTPDADGDVIQYRHRWKVDGKAVELPAVVPAEKTTKGQTWSLEVIPFDGEVEGPPVQVQAVIRNTPPRPPLVRVSEYRPTTTAVVEPTIVVPAADDDGDTITLRYRWRRNGKPAGLPETKASLQPADTEKGQVWDVDVVPFDGQEEGTPAKVQVAIVNTPPTAPVVALSSSEPTTADPVAATVTTPATDADGDSLTYRYRWYVNGERRTAMPLSTSSLAPGTARRGEVWRVEARAFDGEAEGPASTAELRVKNHVPQPPIVRLQPEKPVTTNPLECVVTTRKDTDPDGDPLQHRIQWYVDGKPITLPPSLTTIPATFTHDEQTWSCEVRTTDGELISEPVRSATVTVTNSPPVAPAVSIAPREPKTSDDLVCQLDRPSTDADLDGLTYRYVWRVDQRVYKPGANAPADRVPASETRRGQRWECTVVPSDGKVEGSAGIASTDIVNTAPSAPQVSIAPTTPEGGGTITCEITRASEDADGDRIAYAYTWRKDGQPQSFAPSSTEVPGRLVHGKDSWRCEVVPNDGTIDGPRATSQDVVAKVAKRTP